MADGIVVTLGPDGQGYDYTSVESANLDIVDPVSTAGDYVIEIYSGVNLNGFDKPNRITDESHRIVYRAAPGHEVGGTGVGAGFESNVAANGDAFIGTFTQSTNDTHVDFIGLKIIHLAGGGGTDALYYDDALNNRFFSCFIKSEVSRSLQTENGGTAGVYFENCILPESAGGGTEHNNIGNAAFIEYYRCTIANTGGNGFGDRGFGNRDNLRIRSSLSYGNAGNDFQAKIDQSDCDYLASGDGSSSDASTTFYPNRTTADFVDYANGNYNLSPASPLYSAGEGGEPIGAILGSAPAPSGTEQSVTLAAAEQVENATAVSVAESQTLLSAPLQQMETASAISIAEYLAINSITAEQVEVADSVSVSAAQGSDVVTAEQIEYSSTFDVVASQLLNTVTAEQREQANAVSIEQGGSQSVNAITAEQSEQSQVLTIEQQQALAAVVEQQMEHAELVDPVSVQAVTMVVAEQREEANAVTLSQSAGQLVTLIVAEQAEQGNAVFISQVNAANIINADQREQAQAIGVTQHQSLTQISAQQLEEAEILRIVTSSDQTDLSGLTLIPITEAYSLTPINVETYSLEEI